ncbi:ATP synthase subunit delta [Physcia stellaris]|nr:ATP synthase subunit delta [Physcia stellaris]
MSSLRIARVASRLRPSPARLSVQRRNYADAVSDKIKLTLALPHQSIYKSTDVVQVNVPAESGEMGILANHVPSIEQLKPGLIEVIEESGGSKQFFLSGGFAIVQPGSQLSINAVEGFPLEDFSPEAVRSQITEAQKIAGGSGSEQDIAEAKIELERQTSAARDSTPIRTHSPYSVAEGPIVDRGYVEARVRAIEGDFKQLWVPSSSEPRDIHPLPEWRLKGHQLRAPSITRLTTRSHGQLNDSFTDVFDHFPARRVQDLDYGSPRQRKSLQHISSAESRSHDNGFHDRKSQSLANIRARYEDSPSQGRGAHKRSSSIAQRSSLDPEILCPQPISPLRLGMAVEDDYQDDVEFWNAVHPRALTSIPEAQQPETMGIPSKSIAERMSEFIGEDPEPGCTEPSTVWGSESRILEHPSHSRLPSGEGPTVESHQSCTAESVIEESFDSIKRRKTRPPRKVPDNTSASSAFMYPSENQWASSQIGEPSSQGPDIEPLSKAQRSLTMYVPKRTRTVSIAGWRAKLRSMSVDQLADKRHHETGDTEAPQKDSNVKAGANPSKIVKGEEPQDDLPPSMHSSKTRQSSSVSMGASMSGPRSLRRAWRKWSGWRLVLADKPSQSTEPPGAYPATGGTSTDTSEMKVEEEEDVKVKTESSISNSIKDDDGSQRATTPIQDEPRSHLQSPLPQSPKRPMSLLKEYSHSSISPIAPRPTTALSPPEIPDWTSNFSGPSRRDTLTSRSSLSSMKQSSSSQTRPLLPLKHSQSAASVVTSPHTPRSPQRKFAYDHQHGYTNSSATTSNREQDSSESTSTETIYHSVFPTHKNSHASMRSPWREQDKDKGRWRAEIPLQRMTPSPSRKGEERGRSGERGRTGGRNESKEQRIKRVKVVVSLDGAGDLFVDTVVRQGGDRQGEGRVQSFVKRWEAESFEGGRK